MPPAWNVELSQAFYTFQARPWSWQLSKTPRVPVLFHNRWIKAPQLGCVAQGVGARSRDGWNKSRKRSQGQGQLLIWGFSCGVSVHSCQPEYGPQPTCDPEPSTPVAIHRGATGTGTQSARPRNIPSYVLILRLRGRISHLQVSTDHQAVFRAPLSLSDVTDGVRPITVRDLLYLRR